MATRVRVFKPNLKCKLMVDTGKQWFVDEITDLCYNKGRTFSKETEMEISEKITYLRKQKGWSQEQLAIKVEVSRQAVYKWEAGISQPEIDKLKKLSSLFSVSFDELLDDEIDITKSKEKNEAENITGKTQGQDSAGAVQFIPLENDSTEADNTDDAYGLVNDHQGSSDTAPINNVESNQPDTQKKNNDNKKLWIVLIAVMSAFAICICVLSAVLIHYLLPDNEREDNCASSSSSSRVEDTDDNEANGEQNGGGTLESKPSDDNPTDDEQNGKEPEGVYYTVKFETDGGTPIDDIKVKEGELITGEISTTYEGHTLLGWVNLNTFEEWDFENDRVYEDVTLCAFWMSGNLVAVTYDKNDGSGEVVTLYEDANNLVVLSDVFFDEEKTLLGWTTSPYGALMYHVDEMIYISEPFTLYAVWQKEECFEFVTNQDGGLTLVGYTGTEEYLEIPAYYDGMTVTRIGSYAFAENECVKTVYIPSTVMKLLSDAFNGSYVENIHISESVYSIDATAFNCCYTLQNLFVSVGNGHFASIDGVLYNKERTRLVKYPIGRTDSAYYLPDGTHYVNDYSFYECQWLIDVVIPDGCGGIGISTFEGCSLLKNIQVGNRIDYVGGRAFYNCHSLESIEFEYDLYSIGKEAFFNCYSLETVIIKGNVGVISYHTFGNCIALTTVIVGGEITDELSEYAFEGSDMFTGITYS